MSKALLEKLKAAGCTEYGSVIPTELVHQVLGIEYPEVAPKSVFDELALQELGAIDYVRNALLNEGKYLIGDKAGYRILLPSENKKQVERYMQQADKKLRRASKLSRNTPPEHRKDADQVEARIMLKQKATRQHDSVTRPAFVPATPVMPARSFRRPMTAL